MPRPFTRRQADENARFLAVLRQTGNIRLSARAIGRAYGTMQHRRSADAGFAQRWEAAAAAAHAAFHLSGGRRGPSFDGRPRQARSAQDERRQGKGPSTGSGRPLDCARDERNATLDDAPSDLAPSLRTRGGEPVVVRIQSGRLQMRAAHAGKLTKTAEQVFLLALSATANVRLSAAAAGASPAAFYRRRRKDPAFAREFRLALRMGYERLQAEALRAALPESHEDDDWRHCEPPAIPPMSADQALQLLWLHQKSVELSWDLPHRRRRRGESDEVYSARLAAMWKSEQALAAEQEAVRRALRFEDGGDWRFDEEAPPPPLPQLELVTGWSRASGRPKHDPDVALFGGWRMAHMKRKLAGG